MKYKLKAILIIFISLLFLLALIIWANNKKILLRSNKAYSYNIMLEGKNINNNSYQIIKTIEKDKVKLLYIEKGRFGIWSLTQISEETESEPAYMILPTPSIFYERYDLIFSGNCSNGYVDVKYENLPINTTLNVKQSQTEYTFHLIFFTNDYLEGKDLMHYDNPKDEDILNKAINFVYQTLEENDLYS